MDSKGIDLLKIAGESLLNFRDSKRSSSMLETPELC